MEIVTKDQVLVETARLKEIILSEGIFVHPTDTIYGLGCDARNSEAVKKLRQIKVHMHRPFSVIAPSKHWIFENCELNETEMSWVEKLPGPYTLILKLKKTNAISQIVNLGMDTIGVRIQNHWISSFVSSLGFPIVSTAANLTGEDYMETIDDLPLRIKESIDFVIYEGPIKGRPSMIIKTQPKEQLIER